MKIDGTKVGIFPVLAILCLYLDTFLGEVGGKFILHCVIKQNQHIHPPLNDFIQIKIDSTEVNVSKITLKMICKEFARKKQTVPSAQKKTDLKYSGRLVEKKYTLYHRLCVPFVKQKSNPLNIYFFIAI